MGNATIGRVRALAIALSIAAATVAAPGIASAKPSDNASPQGAERSARAGGPDISISTNGVVRHQSGDPTTRAITPEGSKGTSAIARGAGATAQVIGATSRGHASADGAGSLAQIVDGTNNTVHVVGIGSTGIVTGGNNNTLTVTGDRLSGAITGGIHETKKCPPDCVTVAPSG